MPVDEASATIDTNASDENDLSLRDADDMAQHHGISSPVRRQYLKYGLLGKRRDGKLHGVVERTHRTYSRISMIVPQMKIDHVLEQWLNYMRERRASRPQYGLLG